MARSEARMDPSIAASLMLDGVRRFLYPCASSTFPAVRVVNDVLTWAFTLRACPRRGAGRDASRMRRSVAGLGELGFELGDAPVSEPVVGAGGFQPFLQGPVVVGELADALLERGVLGGQP